MIDLDQKTFDDAVDQYQNMVYRVALHTLGSPADGEDVVQEVFLRLYTHQAGFESQEHLRRWLIRVTVNVCKNILKSPWRRRRTCLDDVGEIPVFDRPEDGALYSAVMRLPEKYRVVLDLYYYEELTTAQIAQALSLRQSAVTTRLFRARGMLKEQLGEEWQND